jgi:hypothetical protein
MRSHTSFLLACCLLTPASVAWAQPVPSPAVEELRPLDMRTPDLLPVDAFVADSTVLSTSLFGIQYGLQQSAQFEQLMQSQGHGGQYVRRAGGLRAHRNDHRDLEGVPSSPLVNAPAVEDSVVETVEIRFIVDEAYRRRTIQSLVWRSIDRSGATTDQAARGSSSSESK